MEIIYDGEQETFEVDIDEIMKALERISAKVEANTYKLVELQATMEARWKQTQRDDERLHGQTLRDVKASQDTLENRMTSLEKAVANLMGRMIVIGAVIGTAGGGVASIVTQLF